MFSNGGKAESFVASGDLSGCLNRIVTLLTTSFKVGIAGAGAGYGVLGNAPKDAEHATVFTDGVVMVRCGGAVTAGDYITSAASGWGAIATNTVQVASGSFLQNVEILGRVEAGCASGMLAAVNLKQHTRAGSL
jgi:hypothetical protein